MHCLLFTGHMIDKPDRKKPRFLPDKEEKARAAIREMVMKEKDRINGDIMGIAGGACGGDILFHEICKELGIPTLMYLALPRAQFLAESVQFAGDSWVARFDNLYQEKNEKELRVLTDTRQLPVEVQQSDYTVWERANLWMLYDALAYGASHMTLIALWDEQAGDKSGGTEHMVQVAKESGGRTIIINTRQLFDLQ